MISEDWITQELSKSFQKSFNQLKSEINLFRENEKSLWEVKDGVTNSAGNLCLHLCGNLQHFIGEVIGHSGYQRDRAAEFSDSGYNVEQLINMIEVTEQVVIKNIKGINKETMEATFPIEIGGNTFTTFEFILHLHTHFHYHTGQINYLRRILN